MKQMNRYAYKDFIIEVTDEPTYSAGSSDNTFNYSKQYFGEGGQEYPVSKHGIKIIQDNQSLNSCIVIASGGATGIHKHSTLLNDDQLLVCCCDTIFCLSLPELDLKWKTQSDQATCFKIIKHHDD